MPREKSFPPPPSCSPSGAIRWPGYLLYCLAMFAWERRDAAFRGTLFFCVGLFAFSLGALFLADLWYIITHIGGVSDDPENAGTVWGGLRSLIETATSSEILSAIVLSLVTTFVTTAIGLLLAAPIGYALSRHRFPGHVLVDSMVDLPIILPPLVVGLSLLVFFQTKMPEAPAPLSYPLHAIDYVVAWLRDIFQFQRPGIVLCQLVVAMPLGIRAMKLTFDGIDPRYEHVAMTLGCTRAGAFFRVTLPMASRGLVVAAVLVWTRAFGLFGPLMVFVGAVRMRTEVMPTTVYLEQSVGNIETALAVALLMIAMTTGILVLVRTVGGFRA